MTIKEQVRELLRVQDVLRQVYVQHDNTPLAVRLRNLDKDFSLTINLLGKGL